MPHPHPKAEAFLNDEWENLRNDASPAATGRVVGALDALHAVGVLDARERELWLRRLQTCPGHDGGRSWCAFCGELR